MYFGIEVVNVTRPKRFWAFFCIVKIEIYEVTVVSLLTCNVTISEGAEETQVQKL